ncbi:Dynein assembly factor 5, axonemal [Orchesella cincta]|uniref:Dynein assembly factor 5, axonemal n=1 Tax=Orchesella cincta TaxID=48709 RepID=A0A1D2MRE6_ORCCI|nr:Dynein assembly factor 5, axonemal [Orchesella cincta]
MASEEGLEKTITPPQETPILPNAQVILTNLRAENKLLRRKTLTGILEEIKSLQDNFDQKCRVSSKQLVKPFRARRRAIKLDSDDEEEGDAEPVPEEDIFEQSEMIFSVYGSVENLIKSLVLSLSDPVEKCRELAYESLGIIVEKSGKKTVSQVLPVVIPTLVERLAQPELIESSEEVRLIAVDFIEKIVEKCQKDMIPYIDDLIEIMLATLGDPYHEVRIRSCEVTSLLAKTMPEVFHYRSELLVKPLCLSLTHQQSRLRRSVAECIGDVLQYGSHKPAEHYVPHLIQRLFDPNQNVRKSVVSIVGNWMMNFSDRYSHFYRFLPIIMSGLCDESPDVSELAFSLWEKIGDQYLEENINDYKDHVDFPAENPYHYPNGVKRPNFGCRMLTHREVCKLIPGVTHDIMDWQDSNRQKSAQLLYHLILNCEEKMTMHVEPLFQCMFRACLDSNPIVIKYVLDSATLLGYFVPMSTCWPLLAENLTCNPSEGCLAVTCSYLKGVDPAALPNYLNDILELMSSPEISQTLHNGKLDWIVSICETVLALSPNAVAEGSAGVLFKILIVVASMSRSTETISRAQGAMDILRQFCGFTSVDELFGLYSGPILEQIKDADAEWTLNTPERLIFTTILTQAGSGIERNMDIVLGILVSYLGPKRDPEVRLSLFTELAGILKFYSEIEHTPQQLEQIQFFVKTIIEDILNKSLVWRAGKSAGALRAAALNCLVTILLGKLLKIDDIVALASNIATGCIGLLDEQLYLNRLFSVKCLGQLFVCCENRLEIDHVNKVYPELLKRMDDENKEVRMASATALSEVYSNLPDEYTVERFKAHLDHAVGVLIVHLDDRDEEIQESVFEALSVIGTICSEVVISNCESFKTKHRSPAQCTRLITKLT